MTNSRNASNDISALLFHTANFHVSNMEPLISQLGPGIMHQRPMTITGNGSNQIYSARLPDHRHLGVTRLLCYVTQTYLSLPDGTHLTHSA